MKWPLFVALFSFLFSVASWGGGSAVLRVDGLVPGPDTFAKYFIPPAGRSPATTDVLPSKLQSSAELRQVEARIQAAKSAKDLDIIISELNSRFDSYPADLQLFAAQLIYFKAYRSWGWKFLPILEFLPEAKRIYSVDSRQYLQEIIGLPIDPNWEIGWKYINSPERVFQSTFISLGQLQSHREIAIYPELLKVIHRISSLHFENNFIAGDGLQPIGFFRDKANRGKKIQVGEADRMAFLAKYHRLAYFSAVSLAYEQSYFLSLQARNKYYSVDFLNSFLGLARVDSIERAKLLRRSSESDYIQLLGEGEIWMQRAYMHLYAAIGYARAAWTQGLGERVRMEANIRQIFPALQEVNDRALMNLWSLVEHSGKATYSWPDGRMVNVDLQSYYRQPPRLARDLMAPREDKSYQILLPGVKTSQEADAALKLLMEGLGMPKLTHPALLLSIP